VGACSRAAQASAVRAAICCQPITGMSNIFRKNLHNLLTYCNSITSPLPYKTRNLISSPLQNSSNNLIGWFYIVVLPR
jgi:hypothetical protein